MEAIKLSSKQAKPIVSRTFPEYKGRKFRLEFRPTITFYDTNWSGGTRNEYRFLRVDGAVRKLEDAFKYGQIPSPWDNPAEGASLPIPEHIVVVEHSFFCGQDAGIRVYAHPCHAPKWIA